VPLAKVTALVIEGLHGELSSRGVSASEQHKVATTLRAALRAAVRLGLLASSPAAAIPRPRVTAREMRPLDRDEVQRLLEAAEGERLSAWFILAIDSGMRPGELFALHWPDVDWDRGRVLVRQSLEEIGGRLRLKIPKTPRSRRWIPLCQATLAALADHKGKMEAEGQDIVLGPVLCNQEGGLVRQSNFYHQVFRPTIRRAGLSLRPYDLRHTCATLLLEAGINIKVVSERLGHESVATTLKHYAHVLPAMQEAATAAMQAIMNGKRVLGNRPPIAPQNGCSDREGIDRSS
jgi:integrase